MTVTRRKRKSGIERKPERGFGDIPDKKVYDIFCRIYNIVAALLGLIIFSPLMLVTAILIKTTSGGPVLYRGVRVGKDGKYFTIFKFRTMKRGAEKEIGARLVDSEKDPHLTPIGRMMRRRKLDEFPQLFNVLRGDMNLVGPRPIRTVFLKKFLEEIPRYHLRFRLRPGITGFAQLRKGYYLSPRNKLRYELIYWKRRSLILDLGIILLTFSRLLSKLFTGFGLLVVLVIFISFMPRQRLFGFHVRFVGMEINILFVYLLLGGLFFIFTHIKKEISFVRTPLETLFLGFSGVSLLSAFFSPGLGAGVKEWAYLVITSFGLFYFVINGLKISREEMKIFIKSYAVITSLAALVGYYGCFWAGRENITASPFYHPEMLIAFLVPWFSFFAGLAKENESRAGRTIAAAALAVAGLMVLISFPPWGLGSILIGVTIFFSGYSRKRLFPVFAALTILVIAFSGRLPFRPLLFPGDTLGANREFSLGRNARVVLTNNQRYLLLGASVGPWWDRVSREVASENGNLSENLAARRLGCMYLTILARNGILGLGFFLSVMAGVLRFVYEGWRRTKDRLLAAFLWSVFSGTIGLMFALLFSDALYFVSVQVSYWLLVGIAASVIIRFTQKKIKHYHVWQYRY